MTVLTLFRVYTFWVMATSRYPMIALVDTGSRQKFISEFAWKSTVAPAANDTVLERRTSPRVWSVFGNHARLTAIMPARVSVKCLRGNQTSASLGAWACVERDCTTEHLLLMERVC